MNRIEVDPEDEKSRKLWKALGGLVERLPEEWVLIGGLMVQLHALEHGITDVRLTATSTSSDRPARKEPSWPSTRLSGPKATNRPGQTSKASPTDPYAAT